MLTPIFDLQQDSSFVFLNIRAPYSKVADAEISIEGCEVKFYSNPYFLRLNLPHEVLEDGREEAKYEADTGYFRVKIPKAENGKEFEGLDMLTKLLAPAGKSSATGPMIEVVGEQNTGNDSEEEIDWEVEQSLPSPDISTGNEVYGFAGLKSGVFKTLQEELCDIIDLQNADTTPVADRKRLREDNETNKFSDEHYLGDYFDEEGFIDEVLQYKPPWTHQLQQVQSGQQVQHIEFTEEEKEQLKNLPRKEFLINKTERLQALLSLVDLLFAYAYNHRTTTGENTVESGWTIAKLSATLSWLQVYSCVEEVAVACYRRSLCYPLYRNWKLTTAVWQDMIKLFKLGRRAVLKALLEVRLVLRESDNRYILDDLYIADYCVWVQYLSSRHFSNLAEKLSEVKIKKEDVRLDLDILEHAAFLAIQEDPVPAISESLAALDLAVDPLTVTAPHVLPNPVTSAERALIEELASSTDSSDSESSEESSEDSESDSSDDETKTAKHEKKLNMSTIIEEKNGEEEGEVEGS